MEEKTMLQIQPKYGDRDVWAALAEREGLCYEALEPSMPQMLDGGADYEACCAWYRTNGRTRSLHGAFIDVNPASGDMAQRSLSRRRCRESCALAVRLGAKNVVFHSSCFPFLRGAYLESWADSCAAFYRTLAETYQLQIHIENCLDPDPQPLAELMRRIADGRVGVCLDIGHAQFSRTPLRGWFDALGEHISYLHLSDNHGLFDEHLPLGEGGVDWEEADRLWRGLNRQTPVTLEICDPGGVERSLRFLKQRGLFGAEAAT